MDLPAAQAPEDLGEENAAAITNFANARPAPAVQEAEVSRVSIKIPPFWTEKPEMWFCQIKAQFEINQIVREQTKFNHLIAEIEPAYLDSIWDLVKTDDPNKYSTAKDRLLKS